MTIEELIKQLEHYDPKLPVLLHGYEGGVYIANLTRPVLVAADVNTEWYYGPHEIVTEYTDGYQGYTKFNGVIIK